jgi:hypothetical protein
LSGEPFRERPLKRMQVGAVAKALERDHGSALEPLGWNDTGEHGLALDEHCAGAAGALPAAELRRPEAELLAQHLDQQSARLDEFRLFRAVHGKSDRNARHVIFLP